MVTLKSLTVRVPGNCRFADLELRREGGALRFNVALMENIMRRSRISLDGVESLDESDIMAIMVEVMVAWYDHHLMEGGAEDEVMEQIYQEIDHCPSRPTLH